MRRWQDRLNGWHRYACGGCNLNRDIAGLITEAGFEVEALDQHYAEGPRFLSFLYRGVARP